MPIERTDVRESSPGPKAVSAGSSGAPQGQSKGKWTARFRRKSEEHQHEKKKQLQDYTAWVNNYLKRKPGTPLIVDLRSNLQDGITFINLIEIVAHIQLEGVDRTPSSLSSRRHNVDIAIEFLKHEGVTLAGDPSKDILDGNSKGIMRVILALAERYQPNTIKQRSSSDSKPSHQREKEEHMTYTLHTESNVLKRSQSPEGNLKGLSNFTSQASNSCSVPNMVSMNVHAGATPPSSGPSGKASVMRSGSSGYRFFGHSRAGRVTTSPTVPSRSPGAGGGYALTHHISSGGAGPRGGGRSQQQAPPPPPPAAQHQGYQFPEKSIDQLRGMSMSQPQPGGEPDDTYATPADTLPPSVGTRLIQPMKKATSSPAVRHHHPLPLPARSRPEDSRRSRALSSPGPPSGGGVAGVTPLMGGAMGQSDSGVLNHEMSMVLTGLSEFKDELMQLHALLLRNSDGSLDSLDTRPTSGDYLDERPIPAEDLRTTPVARTSSREATPHEVGLTRPLSSREPTPTSSGSDTERRVRRLSQETFREQLIQLQDEFTQMESECVTLRNMLEERNNFITTMKSEIYRKEYRNDTQRVDLQNQILQKDATIKKLELDMAGLREAAERKEAECSEVSSQLERKSEVESQLQLEVDKLKTELSHLKESEEVLQSKLASRERRLGHLEDRMAELQDGRGKRTDSVSEDMEGIRKGLSQLRSNFSPQDTHQHVLDQLESNISEMMAQLMTDRAGSPSGGRRNRRHRDSEDYHRDRERRKRYKEKHSSHSASVGAEPKADSSSSAAAGSTGVGLATDITKVFYYMLNDKTETPYVTLVPGRSSEVTLRDFKAVFDRQGTFRFYFKTKDPDCGIVKEEITEDDQVLPNWKGKILVWVTERK